MVYNRNTSKQNSNSVQLMQQPSPAVARWRLENRLITNSISYTDLAIQLFSFVQKGNKKMAAGQSWANTIDLCFAARRLRQDFRFVYK